MIERTSDEKSINILTTDFIHSVLYSRMSFCVLHGSQNWNPFCSKIFLVLELPVKKIRNIQLMVVNNICGVATGRKPIIRRTSNMKYYEFCQILENKHYCFWWLYIIHEKCYIPLLVMQVIQLRFLARIFKMIGIQAVECLSNADTTIVKVAIKTVKESGWVFTPTV